MKRLLIAFFALSFSFLSSASGFTVEKKKAIASDPFVLYQAAKSKPDLTEPERIAVALELYESLSEKMAAKKIQCTRVPSSHVSKKITSILELGDLSMYEKGPQGRVITLPWGRVIDTPQYIEGVYDKIKDLLAPLMAQQHSAEDMQKIASVMQELESEPGKRELGILFNVVGIETWNISIEDQKAYEFYTLRFKQQILQAAGVVDTETLEALEDLRKVDSKKPKFMKTVSTLPDDVAMQLPPLAVPFAALIEESQVPQGTQTGAPVRNGTSPSSTAKVPSYRNVYIGGATSAALFATYGITVWNDYCSYCRQYNALPASEKTSPKKTFMQWALSNGIDTSFSLKNIVLLGGLAAGAYAAYSFYTAK